MTKAQFRRLVVRAIEDACMLLFLTVCIWLVCTAAGAALIWLGVGA